MSKDKLTDYDATAGNNTDIGGISVDEGMLPSNVNNAIREIMSHLKDFAAGTQAVSSIAVSGDLTVDTNTLKVDSTNNRVGVGTSSPSATLDVEGSSNSTYLIVGGDDSSNGRALKFTSSASASFNGAVHTINAPSSQGVIALSTSSAERMRIDSSGNVMVGRTSGSSTTEDAGLVLSTFGYIYSARDGTSNQTHHLFINNAAVSATAVGSIKTSGSSTSYNTTSDYRLKENVADLTGAITRIKNLSPKRFNFTGFTDTVDGFLAHEAQTVVPEAVHGTHNETEAIGDLKDADGNVTENKVVKPDTLQDGYTWTETGTQPVYQGIDQAKLVPVLTAALQEAIAKIEALETQNADLETKVADFETRLTALEG